MNSSLLKKTVVFGLLVCGISSAQAIPMLNGFGGARDYGELAMNRNDDGSSNEINLPFAVNFFGNTYASMYINNNGNVTFNGSLSEYTPEPFPIANQPMIAPYWGDVDTRGGALDGGNNVWVASPNSETVVVTWDEVGYYSSATDRLNSFQLVLRDRAADTGTLGDFDVEFRYEQLEWTTGNASGGSGGLGGTEAQAGYDAGNGTDYFVLPGSRTPDVLNLQDTSNVGPASPGLWSFAIRNGALPGETPDNPLMPVVVDGSWNFEFGIQLDQRIFIDPDVAIGYDYVINTGPNFQTVVLPSIGDNLFDIYLWNAGSWILSVTDWAAGDVYDFGPNGVDRFRIMGIETSAMLDPTDATAFVTGLTFSSAGIVNMNQTALSVFVPSSSVPEPSTLLLLGAGAGLLGMGRFRRKAKHV